MRTMILRGIIASVLAVGLGGVVAAQTMPRGKVYRVAISVSARTRRRDSHPCGPPFRKGCVRLVNNRLW
jgi:hypothetical protein